MMDIEERFARIKKASKNVDLVVINKDNHIIRSSTSDAARTMTGLVQVVDKCREAFKQNNELTFLKILTKKCEYFIVPDKDYMLISVSPADEAATRHSYTNFGQPLESQA